MICDSPHPASVTTHATRTSGGGIEQESPIFANYSRTLNLYHPAGSFVTSSACSFPWGSEQLTKRSIYEISEARNHAGPYTFRKKRAARPWAICLSLLFVVFLAGSLPAFADGCIPYCNVGNIAPTNVFNAVATGPVTGYYVGKGNADDEDWVRMVDVSTNTTGDWVLDNQQTLVGASAVFGVANAGDLLVFELWNQTLDSIFASQPDLSDDGTNHAYATHFSGGNINGVNFPAGTYVGMEDWPNGIADWNYQDNQFVATNVEICARAGELARTRFGDPDRRRLRSSAPVLTVSFCLVNGGGAVPTALPHSLSIPRAAARRKRSSTPSHSGVSSGASTAIQS